MVWGTAQHDTTSHAISSISWTNDCEADYEMSVPREAPGIQHCPASKSVSIEWAQKFSMTCNTTERAERHGQSFLSDNLNDIPAPKEMTAMLRRSL